MNVNSVKYHTPFPKELKKVLSSSLDTRHQSIKRAISDDKTRQVFKKWTEEHEKFVEQSPVMQIIKKEAYLEDCRDESSFSVMQENPLKFLLGKIGKWFGKPSISEKQTIAEKIENGSSLRDLSEEEVNHLITYGLEYVQSGLLSMEKLQEAIVRCHYNQAILLQEKSVLNPFMPLLMQLNGDQLLSLFLAKNDGMNLFFSYLNHYDKQNLKQLLEKFSDDQFSQFVSALQENTRAFTGTLISDLLTIRWPRLLQLEEDKLRQLFSVKNLAGESLFAVFKFDFSKKKINSIFQKFNPFWLINKLSETDDNGRTLLFNATFAECAQNMINQISDEQFLSEISDPTGVNFLFNHAVEYFLPHLEKLSAEQLIPILTLQDARGKTPLHYQLCNFEAKVDERLKNIFSKLSPEECVQILSIQDREGRTILHTFPPWNHLISPFGLEKLDAQLRMTLLSIQDYAGETPISKYVQDDRYWDYGYGYEQIFKMLEDCTDHQLAFLFFLNNSEERNLLDHQVFYDWFKARIEKMSRETFVQLLSAPCKGNRPFVNQPCIFNLIRAAIQKHQIDVSLFDIEGELPLELSLHYQLSESWVTKDKIPAGEYPILSKEDYDKQVALLKEQVNELWNSIEFKPKGKEAVEESLLVVNDTPYSKYQIGKLLDEMLGLMVNETAWLGTPRADQPEKVHRFYCEMLFNFQQLTDYLRNQLVSDEPPSQSELNRVLTEIAGYLIDIAAIRIEERCATAYQMEILQKKQLAHGEVADVDRVVEDSAANALLAIVEKIVREHCGNDSHYMTQFLYAAGLVSEPDSLLSLPDSSESLSVEKAQGIILQIVNMENIFKGFAEGVSHEMAVEWFKKRTPEDFGPEYLTLRQELQLKEQAIRENAARQMDLPAEISQKILDSFRTYGAAKLPEQMVYQGRPGELLQGILAKGHARFAEILRQGDVKLEEPPPFSPEDYPLLDKNMVQKVKERLPTLDRLRAHALLMLLQNMDSKTELADVEAKLHLLLDRPLYDLTVKDLQTFGPKGVKELENRLVQTTLLLFPVLQKANPNRALLVTSQLRREAAACASQLHAAVNFERHSKQLSAEQKIRVFQAKIAYDKHITALGEALAEHPLGISFNMAEYSLPSLCCDNARRVAANQEYITSRSKALGEMFKRLGIILPLKDQPLS